MAMMTCECGHEVPTGAKFCPECGKIADLGAVLVSRIHPERWPQPTEVRELASCGKTGRLVENMYPGQKFPWGLYEQSGHAASLVLVAETTNGQRVDRRVCLVRQWRPVDTECYELPAGNIGVLSPDDMMVKTLRELEEEVGAVKIERIFTSKGFAHDVGREIAAGGGPKCFFPFVMYVTAEIAPKTHLDGDEATHSKWYSFEEVKEMVQDGRIGDMVTILFLLSAGIIGQDDLIWTEITHLVAPPPAGE